MMQEIARFFLPPIGSGLVRALAVVFNLACVLAGILLLAYLGWVAAVRLVQKRGEPPPGRPSLQALALSGALAACATAVLAWLPYGAAGWNGVNSVGITNDWIFRVLLDALDPLLLLRSLTSYPTPLFGLNLTIRALVLWVLALALLFVWGRVRALWGLVRRFWVSLFPGRERGPLGRMVAGLAKQLAEQVLHLLSLIPFLLRHIFRAARSFLSTMLQIFVGYSTESDKNRAVFVAACFASLASLLNTFFGLTGFYSSDKTWIPVVCSFAIACAVQLAMLIFGMRAGEGIAEGMMLEQRFRRGGLLQAIAGKVFACVMYLLVYAAFLIVLYGGIFDGGTEGRTIIRYLPILLTVLGTALLAYAAVRQGLEIHRLWKAYRTAREDAAADRPLPLPLERLPRRLPSWFYLTAYLLLMLVSTGFAFNNMFGYYASSAKLHERVYDQVRYETVSRLGLNETVSDMARVYSENTNHILSALEEGSAAATAVRQEVRASYDAQVGEARDAGSEALAGGLENVRDRYVSRTSDFETTVSVLKSFLQMDYDSIGTEVTITTEEYAHYWRGRAQESYRTTYFDIALPGHRIAVGNPVTGGAIDRITASDGQHITFPQIRYPDPDSVDQSIIRTARSIPNADKYVILRTLLSQYQRLESDIYSADGAANGPLTDMDAIYTWLDQNAEIDGVRGSVAALYAAGRAAGSTAKVAVLDLPRIVDAYLGTAGAAAAQGSGELTKYAAYERLDAYVDRALDLDGLLSGYTGGAETGAEGSGAYLAQQFRNYAQGITYSDFQISYDALLHGGLGINPSRDAGLTALYAASPIAWFLLLICALVDFSAFFAGLLLFKDIYLFRKNEKIIEVGYLNYEAELTNFFTPPESGTERLLHLAFLYKLLYGVPEEKAEEPPALEEAVQEAGPAEEPSPEEPAERAEPSEAPPEEPPAPAKQESPLDTARLRAILASPEFEAFCRGGEAALSAFGIRRDGEDSGYPDLLVWLSSFVKKNDISFDVLFREEDAL